jgi:hypothetical protein
MIKTVYCSIMKLVLLNRPKTGLSLVTVELYVQNTPSSPTSTSLSSKLLTTQTPLKRGMKREGLEGMTAKEVGIQGKVEGG